MSPRKARKPRGKDVVLVDRAGGFLGSHVVQRLCRGGWRVRATDLPSSNLKLAAEASAEVVPCNRAQDRQDFLGYMNGDFILDTTRIKSLGFELKHPSTLEGMSRTLAWYRQEGLLPA